MLAPAISLLGLCLASPAYAATLVVNSSGHGTRADCKASSKAFSTIAAAYAAAAAGDTIFVCPGRYAERLAITRPITLDGAQAGASAAGRTGPESVMDDASGSLLINAPGVTVDGFTFEGQTSTAAQGGVITTHAGGITVVNDIFRGNHAPSVLVDGSGGRRTTISGNAADSGISLGSASLVTVSGNQITTPTATGYGVQLSGGDSGVVVTGNWLIGGQDGILVQDAGSGPNRAITATGNCIAGNTTSGLTVETGSVRGSLQASANWWGATNGPSGTQPGWGDAWIDPSSRISSGAFLVRPTAPPCPQLPLISVSAPPPLSLGPSVTGTVVFTVHLSSPYYARTGFTWTTLGGTAKPGSDFHPAGGAVVIPAGQTTAALAVRVTGTTAAHQTRQFAVALSAPVNATITGATAIATVHDTGALPVTGPGVVPVGGVATGGIELTTGGDPRTVWKIVAALGIALVALSAAFRLRGLPARRAVPAAGAGSMAAIAACGVLIGGGHTLGSPIVAPSPVSTAAGMSEPPPRDGKPPAAARLHAARKQAPQKHRIVQAVVVPPPQPQPPPNVSPSPSSAPGMRIQIPAIRVYAPVVDLGLNTDSTLQVPSSASEAGWWGGGTYPGNVGPAVIVGHVNWDGQLGVFARLVHLRRGDLIRVIEPDGAVDSYVVTGRAVYPKSQFPTKRVYGPLHYAGLRLITCTGEFDGATGHYLDNLIVFARMTGRSAPAPPA